MYMWYVLLGDALIWIGAFTLGLQIGAYLERRKTHHV